MTIDVDMIPADELRTRLKVANETLEAKDKELLDLRTRLKVSQEDLLRLAHAKDAEIQRLEDQLDGMDATHGLAGGALEGFQDTALVGAGAGGDLAPTAGTPRDAAPTLQDVAAFIGLPAQYATSSEALLKGLRELRDGGAAGEEGSPTDTLSEAIEHNRTERLTLGRELRAVRQIVTQVAAALQVGAWDKDGTEIVERAQRLSTIDHVLRQRLKTLEDPKTVISHDPALAAARRQGAVDEVRWLLTQLLAPDALQKFMAARPNFVATPAMFEAATSPSAPSVPFLDTFTITQLEWVIDICTRDLGSGHAPPEVANCQKLLQVLGRSAAASNDVVAMFKGAVLPILRMQIAKGIVHVGDLVPSQRPDHGGGMAGHDSD